MNWNDWPIPCWIISTLLSLWLRRWIDAVWSACLLVFLVFDRMPPATIPWQSQVKFTFLGLSVLLIAFQVGKEYRRYKKSLSDPVPVPRTAPSTET
jgi:uncharacterized membrane protein YhaH (DUF805 family)